MGLLLLRGFWRWFSPCRDARFVWAITCALVSGNDGADPRAGLSQLNALIVHANGAAEAPGPCGIPWDSPFAADVGADADKALAMLQMLPDNFRGDPTVFLNRPMKDGHAPVDIVVRFGCVRVASALAAHGARFLPRHLADAQQHGHMGLTAFIIRLL